MNHLYTAAAEIQRFCRERDWEFCFIGGLALLRWGEVRQTQDVDLTVWSGFGDEAIYARELLATFRTRRDDAFDFAMVNRVLVLSASNDVAIDVSLGALPYEESLIRRATPFEYMPGVPLTTASAEDMVTLKAFAGRPKDWFDVRSIIVRQGERLDWDLILRELAPLCELKESPEIVDQLLLIRDELAAD